MFKMIYLITLLLIKIIKLIFKKIIDFIIKIHYNNTCKEQVNKLISEVNKYEVYNIWNGSNNGKYKFKM